ncbi:MAG: glycosyltransferase family 39 protein [Planctomycetota bacterium]|nr:glycosyltransferase family 39 protein [Planctomycetota bacterium]
MENPSEPDRVQVEAGPALACTRRRSVARWSIVGVTLCAALLVRLLFLTADPPLDLCWSHGSFTDEGSYTISARNHVIFGDYSLDGKPWPWDVSFVHPVWDWVLFAVYKIVGVGLFQARAAAVAVSMLFLVVLWRCGNRLGGGLCGLLALVFGAFSYVMLMYNRVSIVENLALLLTSLGLYMVLVGDRRALMALLAGIVLAFSVFAKLTSIFAWGIGLLWLLMALLWSQPAERKVRTSVLLSYVLASGLTAGFFIALWHIPSWESITALSEQGNLTSLVEHSSLVKVLATVRRFFPSAGLFVKMPVVTVLGFTFAVWAAMTWRKREAGERFLVLWLALGCAFFSVWNYRPLRYLLLLAPPLILLGALALSRWCAGLRGADQKGQDRVPQRYRLARQLWFAVAWAVVVFLVFTPLRRQFSMAQWQFVLFGLVVLFAASAGAALLRRLRPGPSMRTALTLCVILVFLAIESIQHWKWVTNRRYTVQETSRELGMILPPSAVILGRQMAAQVAYEHRLPTYSWVAIWDSDELRDLVGRLGVTHVLCGEGEIAKCAAVFAGYKLMRTFEVGPFKLFLYRVLRCD